MTPLGTSVHGSGASLGHPIRHYRTLKPWLKATRPALLLPLLRLHDELRTVARSSSPHNRKRPGGEPRRVLGYYRRRDRRPPAWESRIRFPEPNHVRLIPVVAG